MTLGKEVLNTSEFVSDFDAQKISNSIFDEVNYVASIFDMEQQISKEEADEVARKVEAHILTLNGNLKVLSGPLIREMVCGELKGRNRDFYTRVGLSIADAFKIDNASSDVTHDNANQTKNAETKHKQKADQVAKEQALLTIPQHLSLAHMEADIHIHDLEYFTTRTFCMDWDLRFFFYYGLDPDCTGKTNIATAAMQPTVALLHAAKILGSAQTNFAGGQGFYNFITFIAPYLEGLPYMEVKQLMQMFIFEISQTMVARGAQVVFSSVQLAPGIPKMWRDKPAVYKGVVWNGEDGNEHRVYGDFEKESRLAFRALMEVMHKGDAWGKLFNFPKPEIAFEKEFMADHEDDDYYDRREAAKLTDIEAETPMTYSELYNLVMALTIKFGTPYYDNMLPLYRQSDGISCYQCCMPPSVLTPIEVNNGISLKSIAELKKDSKVLSNSGFNLFEDMLVLDFDGELNKITLDNGRFVECTNDHQIPVNRDGDEIVLDADSVEKGDVIEILSELPRKNQIPKFHASTIEDDNEYNRKFSYLMGLYVAEGSSDNSGVTNRHITFSFGKDENNLIDRTIESIKEIFGYDAKVSKVNRNGIVVFIHSNEIFDWFESNSIAMKGYSMTVPPFIFTTSDENKFAFLHGYFHGDGCFRSNGSSKTKIIEINTISKELAQGAVILLSTLGFNVRYGEYEDKRPDRKRKYCIYLSRREEMKDFFACQRRSPITSLEVKKVEKIPYHGKVYDPINVENGHVFSTGTGIVVSNCAFAFSAGADSKDFEKKMNFENGEHFSMGANQVVSTNTPRAAYKVPKGDFDALEAECKRLIIQAIEVHEFKRDWIKKLWYNGHIPFATQQLRHHRTLEVSPPAVDYEELVYTIGVIGMNEVALHHTGYGLDDDIGLKFSIKLLNRLTDFVHEESEERDIKLVLARTPAESASQRFAVSDLMAYPNEATPCIQGDIETALDNITTSRNLPIYYSNGTHLPVDTKIGIIDRMNREGKFFHVLDGGNIFHVWMGEEDPSPEALKEFVFNILNKTEIGYFTFTKDFSLCEPCGKQMNGIKTICDRCGSEDVKAYSRITGYIQDISGWNDAKLQELKERTRIRVI